MKGTFIFLIGFVCLAFTACNRNDVDGEFEVEIPDFNFPQTVVWEPSLSAYNIFEGAPADLVPSSDFHVVELSSVLFSDYAHKQRLLKVPSGTQMTKLSDGSIGFPDGSMLTKTFFYFNDARDADLGKRIIETRLLIKENGTWNAATYLWNEAQTDATLELNGYDTQVSTIRSNGSSLSTLYHVPNENECIACHQSNSSMSPLGPTLRNMNRFVERNGSTLNQIEHLQALGVLEDFPLAQAPQISDYKDLSVPLAERGRAYLALNCSHCHNPTAWEPPAKRDFDFRIETPFEQTGILSGKDRIVESVIDGEMPFIGTTVLDEQGVGLVIEYLNSL